MVLGTVGVGALDAHRVRGADPYGVAEERAHFRAGDAVRRPLQVDLEAAACPQSPEGTGGPGVGQGGQQLDLVRVTLHQHLGDAGDAAEVAVDLEGRVQVEEVGRGARRGEQVRQVLVGAGRLQQPRPHVDLPGEGPALSRGAAQFQALLGGRGELRGAPRGDLGAREDAVQVGHVAALDQGRLLPVHQPLLDLAQVADAGGGEPVADLGDAFDEPAVAVQHLRGLPEGVEEVPQQLHVHRGAGADADALPLVLVVGDLRRLRGVGDEPAGLRVHLQGVEEELHRALHHRVVAAERARLAGEPVVVPQHHAQPGAAGGPHAVLGGVHRCRAAPAVGVVVQDPAGGVVQLPCGAAAGLGEFVHHPHGGVPALGEVAGAGGPVVHLEVDVDGVLGLPGRVQAVVPQALEVGGLSGRPGAGGEQVPAVLEVERGQLGVLAVGEQRDAFVGGQARAFGGAEVDADPAEQAPVVGDVPGAQEVVRLARGRRQVLAGAGLRVRADVEVVAVAGRHGDHQGDAVGVLHGECAAVGAHPAALGLGACQGPEAH